MYYLYFLLIPLVLYMLIRGFRSQRKWLKDNSQFQVGEIAKRLKLQIIKGDPSFNLVMTGRQNPGAPTEVSVLLQGKPYEHAFELSYYDKRWTEHGILEKKLYQNFESYFSVETSVEVLQFELMLQNPNQIGAPSQVTSLPKQTFGNSDLDEAFVLYTNNQELAQKLVPILHSLLSSSYLHIVGQGHKIRFVMTEFGMMTAMYQLDALVHALESMACVFEGKPALGTYSGIVTSSELASVESSTTQNTLNLSSMDNQRVSVSGYQEPSTQIPIPCKGCGAPMKEMAATHLTDKVQVVCEYCHAKEELPTEQKQRVLALRTRLTQLKWAESANDAASTMFNQVSEKGIWLPAILFLLLMMGLQGYQVYEQFQKNRNLTVNRAQILGEIFGWQFMMIGILFGVILGMVAMWLTYRTAIRPKLLARPPLHPDQALRCRHCGGDLPKAVGPFIPCNFCNAQNLVTPEIARNQASLLEKEIHLYQKRATEQGKQNQKTVKTATHWYYYALIGGVVFGVLLSQLVKWLLPRFL